MIISLPLQTRGMTASAIGGVGGAGSCPSVRAGVISAACACVAATYESAPDDHFMAGPDCRVTRSTLGSIGHGGSCPSVRAGKVLRASPKGASAIITAPDDHHSARSTLQCDRSAVGTLLVLVAVQLFALGLYFPPVFIAKPPTIRPRQSFHCRSIRRCVIIGQRARWPCWSPIQLFVPGLYLPPVFKGVGVTRSAPDNHLAASPDCRVPDRGDGALVALVAVQLSVPGLYLPPVPQCSCHRCLPKLSFRCQSRLLCDRNDPQARWLYWSSSSCPYWDHICRRVERSEESYRKPSPNDHFSAGPHCCVTGSAIRGARSGCPCIVSAARCYCGQRVPHGRRRY